MTRRFPFLLLLPSYAAAQVPFQDLHRPLPYRVAPGVVLADLDGDDAPDCILAGVPGEVLRNDGDGNFLAAESVTRSFGGASVAAPLDVGDLDGDGHQDVVARGVVFLGDGTGRLSQVPGSPIGSGSGVQQLVDFDGDGDLDLVQGRFSGLLLWRNRGDATFEDASAGAPPGAVGWIGVLDVEGDGDADLVVSEAVTFGGSTRLLRNDGSGAFAADPSAIPAGGATPIVGQLLPGDVDGDGDVDLVVGSALGFGLFLLENDGGGVFSAASTLGGTLVGAPLLADLDGDGDLDLVDPAVGLLLENDGSGSFSDASDGLPPIPSAFGAIAAGDVDRDGDLDLFVAGSSFASRLLLGDGALAFVDSQLHLPAEELRPLVVADLDGDGDPDVLGSPAQSTAASRLEVRRNDGTGVLASAPELFLDPPPRAAEAAAAGDVDGDGDLDLLSTGVVDELFLASLAGYVDASASLPAGGALGRAVELLDVDRDGDLDAVLARGTYAPAGAANEVWHNDGGGAFLLAGATPEAVADSYALAAGDVDGDGSLDLYVGNQGQDALLLGDGAGGFVDATAGLPAEAASHRTFDVGLADMDGDGDLDAYTVHAGAFFSPLSYEGGFVPASDRLLRNDGSGVFAADPGHATTNVGWALALGDIDGDGDTDALVASASYVTPIFHGGEVRAYVNDGAGALRPTVLVPEATSFAAELALALADLDRDGDRDLLLGDRVLTNLTRGLAWVGLPRAGRTLELALYGPAEASWILVAAGGTAALPTDLGLLQVDPDRLLLVRAGSLGPAGRDVARFCAPAALAGATVWWQAVVGGRLTNLEATPFF